MVLHLAPMPVRLVARGIYRESHLPVLNVSFALERN